LPVTHRLLRPAGGGALTGMGTAMGAPAGL